MHYIAGTTITISERSIKAPIRPGMTSQQLRAASSKSSEFEEQKKQFKPGVVYTLNRISKQHDVIQYQFSSNSGERAVVHFDSITSAEKFISEQRNEHVPDYSSVYDDKSD